ncbi:PREDICTED: COP9 signalosome complex subunit 8-like isoform X2 [Rhagoletis zephyria]|uniref:COP9 signalosome complex subunit 8-like isoform X2 n=1 Tax=Rhagoletis zephyria TaxID=28612 RepID=UPI00081130A1|nr:PREDICTED: COP9 signalosome complex subunit 8-like isoform X2 [Rhagoletis zephyria]
MLCILTIWKLQTRKSMIMKCMESYSYSALYTNIDAESYTQLLAVYLFQDKLADAKFLWKRIPQALKKDSNELQRLNVVMSTLIVNNPTDFFKQVDYPWSINIKLIMDDLIERVRQDVLTLVGQAYISIFEQELIQLTRLPQQDLKRVCVAMEWKYENDGQKAVIIPKNSEPMTKLNASSEDLLLKLTDFVSFLEN